MKRINKGRAVIVLFAIALVVVSQAQTVPIADPTQGQSPQQQQQDDKACQTRSKNTTGIGPVAVAPVPSGSIASNGIDTVHRTYFACMEGLGYTIRQKRVVMKPAGHLAFEVFFLLPTAALVGYFGNLKERIRSM